jgi:hypothetical protein
MGEIDSEAPFRFIRFFSVLSVTLPYWWSPSCSDIFLFFTRLHRAQRQRERSQSPNHSEHGASSAAVIFVA